MLRFLGVLHFIVVFLWLPPPVSARISGGRRFWVATPILGCRYGATVFGRLGAFLMVLRLPLCSTTGGDGARCECRVYPVGAPMAKKHPPGGEGLSHTPADGGDYPSKGTLLPPFVNGWRAGSVLSPGYVRRSEDRLSEPRFRPQAWSGMALAPGGRRTWRSAQGTRNLAYCAFREEFISSTGRVSRGPHGQNWRPPSTLLLRPTCRRSAKASSLTGQQKCHIQLMENVTLTPKEQTRLKILNSLLAEHLTLDQAASLMGVSPRHTRRILAAYHEKGAATVARGW